MNDEIANEFLVETLGISDWKLKLKENKLEFLREFKLVHSNKLYYHTVNWAAVEKPYRKSPTVEEVISYGLVSSTQFNSGGTCVHLNYFTKLVLDQLGFDTCLVALDMPGWPPKSHMGVVVHLPKENQGSGQDQLSIRKMDVVEMQNNVKNLYLMDMGFGGRPILEPIPLGHLPYNYKSGGFQMQYRFNADKNVYERIAKNGCPFFGKFEPEAYDTVDYFFELTPLDFDDFWECWLYLFSDKGVTPWLDTLMLCRTFNAKSVDDYSYINCRNVTLIEGTQDTFKETTFYSYQAMLPSIRKHFPNINFHQLDVAIANFEKLRREKLAAKAAQSKKDADTQVL